MMKNVTDESPTPYDLSIIIACYNEEGLLEDSIRDIEYVMCHTKYTYELIFIDDCSRDKTRDVIKRLAKDKQYMKYVFHEKNVGRGGTVCEGIRMARGKVVGFLDIDLEVHARYIPSMLWAIKDGYDIATAHRVYKIHPGAIPRHVLSMAYRKLLSHFLKTKLIDTETGFKFFNREKILSIIDACKNKGWFWDTEVMILSERGGLKIKEIPCLFLRRVDKISSVNVIYDSFVYLINLWKFKSSLPH